MEATRRRTWPLMGELQTNRDPALFPGSMSFDSRPIQNPVLILLVHHPVSRELWYLLRDIRDRDVGKRWTTGIPKSYCVHLCAPYPGCNTVASIQRLEWPGLVVG